MQPYFLPYIGYFQLIAYCDTFVVYDDIEYTKKGWINRNRILASGNARTITVPLRRDSDYLDVRDREIAPEFDPKGTLALLQQSYGQAPYWPNYRQLLESILQFPGRNLFDFVANSISRVMERLDIRTEVVVSSTLGIDRAFRGEERVLEHVPRSGRRSTSIRSAASISIATRRSPIAGSVSAFCAVA